MHDAFSKSGSGTNARRRVGTGGLRLSPSYGVRKGYIKDPNWPPPQLPGDGSAAQRRYLRVKCGFMIRVPGGGLVPTYGDISSGGAKFTLEAAIGSEVEVLAGDVVARATVLQVLKGGGQFVYRVKFDDAACGEQVFDSIYAAA